jgi:GGDEF domain-containing protein
MLVDEKLRDILINSTTWAIQCIAILGLDTFRELYGFVASDDVLRAVTLMMNNAIREVGSETDFIGHIGPSEFVIITNSSHMSAIRERLEVRIRQSMEYFYPLKDREKAKQAVAEQRLRLIVWQVLASDGNYFDPDELKQAIQAAMPK